jgi:hypothetical protein
MGTIFAGAPRKAVAELAKDSDVVFYCGRCPMAKCANIRR